MRRIGAILAAGLVVAVGPAAGIATAEPAAAPAAPAAALPSGYARVSRHVVARGVVHERLVRRAPEQSVHVARIAPDAAVSLRVVRAGRSPDGRTLERPSSLCRRVRCHVAVNGDFFDPETGTVVGGVVTDGVPVRSPNARHHQLTISPDGRFAAGVQRWSASLVPTDLEPLAVTGVNVPRGRNAVVVYTASYGATTGTNAHGVELVADVVAPRPPMRLGQTALVRIASLRVRKPGATIPRGGIVLSGHGKGAAALEALWRRIRAGRAGAHALLRIESDPPVAESLGGAPVLVRQGRRFVASTGPAFVTGRHPRTAVGWTRGGELLLVTVDGRRPGHALGMSLPELADLLVGLGAVEALNLDGGGSTTFVKGGAVLNRPSDRLVRRDGRPGLVALPGRGDATVGDVERPVANVLAVVPRHPLRWSTDPLAGGRVDLPEALSGVPSSVLFDPGSDPHGALPALVSRDPDLPDRPVGFAVGLVSGVSLATLIAVVRRPRRPSRHRRRGPLLP